MAKKRIASLLLALTFTTPLVDIATMQVNSKPQYGENLDLRNYKLKQVQEIIDVEIQKLKEIELQKQKEEEERQKEIKIQEEMKQPHFNPYDVTEVSNLNKDQIYKMLEGTTLVTLVDAFYWYEQEYNVNLIFIASIVALESGWGRSSLATSHNNLTGYIGQDGNYYYFNDWAESLQETFRLIDEEYISEDGLFYNGLSIWNINQKYCELDSWADKIINISNDLFSKINK